MPHPSPPDGEEALPELGFDPEAVLERDSRVLLDPSFLATLHLELAAELAPEDMATTLFQMGFLHGLQDAARLLVAEPRGHGSGAFAPPLRMPCRPLAPSDGSGSVVLTGCWPEQREAEAHLQALGRAEAASCHLTAGYASGWLSGAFDLELLAVETECGAAGGDGCRFVAREGAAWRAGGDPALRDRLATLPIGHFRALVRERLARRSHEGQRSSAGGTGVDRRAAAVHVWGPVMVLPWSGPEVTLQTLEVLARDAGAAEVSVIVLDLHGEPIEETYGALALERVVETSDAWGTEVLLVDPSPLSASLLADLDPQPLLTLKDLEPAVTLAFQIARSQRRIV